MSAAAGDAPSRVEVLASERVLDDVFRLERVRLRFERFDGTMSAPITRLLFERGDAVAVLPYDPDTRRVLLVRQFRYPAHVRGGSGWLWEIIAGVRDDPEEAEEEVACREAQEEAGLQLGALERMMRVFPSPGACSERVTLFLAPVPLDDDLARFGGLAHEAEDILVRTFDFSRAWGMVQSGEIADAKTVLALQCLARRWMADEQDG